MYVITGWNQPPKCLKYDNIARLGYNNFSCNRTIMELIPPVFPKLLGDQSYRHIKKLLNQKLLHLIHINVDLYQKF